MSRTRCGLLLIHCLRTAIPQSGRFVLPGMSGLMPLAFAISTARKQPDEAVPLTFLIPRFSRVAVCGVLILSISGLYSYFLHINQLDLLIATTYGRTLLVKTGLFVLLFCLGAVNLLFLTPRLRSTGNQAVILKWPLAMHLPTHLRLGAETAATVPLFNLWTLTWNVQRLVHGYAGYWDAPIFYPEPGTFALSDPQPLTGLLFAIPYFLTNNGVLAYNLVFFGFLALNGIAGARWGMAGGSGQKLYPGTGLLVFAGVGVLFGRRVPRGVVYLIVERDWLDMETKVSLEAFG